jgi:hypothetical protein
MACGFTKVIKKGDKPLDLSCLVDNTGKISNPLGDMKRVGRFAKDFLPARDSDGYHDIQGNENT